MSTEEPTGATDPQASPDAASENQEGLSVSRYRPELPSWPTDPDQKPSKVPLSELIDDYEKATNAGDGGERSAPLSPPGDPANYSFNVSSVLEEHEFSKAYYKLSPEQANELFTQMADRWPKLLERVSSHLPDMLKDVAFLDEAEATLQAIILLQTVLNKLKTDPVIQASPLVADFVADVIQELGGSSEPHEIFAKLAKENARKAIDARYTATRELKRRVLEEYARLKEANPRISKNKAAGTIAPLAVRWSEELQAGLRSMDKDNVISAQKLVRSWLTPSRNRSSKRTSTRS
ncbi:hypothetical protein [Candidatus Igneacidithiobacillus taiwanensis]|uniref:hypothetical protein n=1 Tax=Candidatus Igneacidithiobacillus taiwanensis TaxID=1945924 RepID=UPI00289F5334|nr:hypothetical protein [Candidatus Igneacidithiobacillus taiwanensis]